MKTINSQTLAKQNISHPVFIWTFILTSISVISIIVQVYSVHLGKLINPISFWVDALLTASMFPFQAIFLTLFKQERKLEYLVNLAFISVTGAILLLPILGLGKLINLNDWVYIIGFFFVHFFMIGFHFYRMKQLHFDARLTLSLVLFRIVLLIIVLTFIN